tara:strand:- start:634 stop:1074 length:441 start_codon:yes stop_codon:yes gene_type:complete
MNDFEQMVLISAGVAGYNAWRAAKIAGSPQQVFVASWRELQDDHKVCRDVFAVTSQILNGDIKDAQGVFDALTESGPEHFKLHDSKIGEVQLFLDAVWSVGMELVEFAEVSRVARESIEQREQTIASNVIPFGQEKDEAAPMPSAG